eukprot:6064698-Prymnesium_polylepis.1
MGNGYNPYCVHSYRYSRAVSVTPTGYSLLLASHALLFSEYSQAALNNSTESMQKTRIVRERQRRREKRDGEATR